MLDPRTREEGVGVVIDRAGMMGLGVTMLSLRVALAIPAALVGLLILVLIDNLLPAPGVSPGLARVGVDGILLVLATNLFLVGVTLPDLEA